jgi:hypothetical protein
MVFVSLSPEPNKWDGIRPPWYSPVGEAESPRQIEVAGHQASSRDADAGEIRLVREGDRCGPNGFQEHGDKETHGGLRLMRLIELPQTVVVEVFDVA